MEIGKSWRDARSARRIVPQGTSLENSNFYSKNLKIPYPSLRGYVEDHNGWNYLTPGYFSDSQDQGYYARSGNEHSNSPSGYYGFISSVGQGKLAKGSFVWSRSFVGRWAFFQKNVGGGKPTEGVEVSFSQAQRRVIPIVMKEGDPATRR